MAYRAKVRKSGSALPLVTVAMTAVLYSGVIHADSPIKKDSAASLQAASASNILKGVAALREIVSGTDQFFARKDYVALNTDDTHGYIGGVSRAFNTPATQSPGSLGSDGQSGSENNGGVGTAFVVLIILASLLITQRPAWKRLW